jgi:hypothetical protein
MVTWRHPQRPPSSASSEARRTAGLYYIDTLTVGAEGVLLKYSFIMAVVTEA